MKIFGRIRQGLSKAYAGLTFGMAAFRNPGQVLRAYQTGLLTDHNKFHNPRPRSLDTDVRRAELRTLGLLRDSYQNNANVSGTIERVLNAIFRRGIKPSFQFIDKDGGLRTEENKKFDLAFERWTNYSDFAGRKKFYRQQKIGGRHIWTDGGFLVHRLFDASIPEICPLRIELIEVTQFDRRKDGQLDNGNFARRGLEYNAQGELVAFHLFKQNPTDYLSRGVEPIRIPATHMHYVADEKFITQYHGISKLAPVVLETHDLEEYRKNTRVKARAESGFVAFVKRLSGKPTTLGGIPAGGSTSPIGEQAENQKPGENIPTEISAGMIHDIGSSEVELASNNTPGASYKDFTAESRMMLATAAGVTYETVSSDYSKSKWTSVRGAKIEMEQTIEDFQILIEDEFNSKIVEWWLDDLVLTNLNPMPMTDYATNPYPYREQVSSELPGNPYINPKEDITAATLAIDATLDTRTAQNARRGKNWNKTISKLIEEEESLIKLAEIKATRKEIEKGNDND